MHSVDSKASVSRKRKPAGSPEVLVQTPVKELKRNFEKKIRQSKKTKTTTPAELAMAELKATDPAKMILSWLDDSDEEDFALIRCRETGRLKIAKPPVITIDDDVQACAKTSSSSKF